MGIIGVLTKQVCKSMLKNLRERKIKTILLVLISIFTLVMLISPMFFYAFAINNAINMGESEFTAVSQGFETSINSYLEDIISDAELFCHNSTVQKYLKSENSYDRNLMVNDVVSALSVYLNTEKSIQSILISGNENYWIVQNRDESYYEMQWGFGIKDLLPENGSRVFFSEVYASFDAKKQIFFLTMPINDYEEILNQVEVNEEQLLGYISVAFDFSRIRDIIGEHSSDNVVNFIEYDTGGFFIPADIKLDTQVIGEPGYFNTSRHLQQSTPVDTWGWTLHSIGNKTAMTADINRVYMMGYIIVLVVIVIISLVSRQLLLAVTKPIEDIAKQAEIAQNIIVGYRVQEKYKNEMGTIATGINKILESYDAVTRNILQTQQQLYEAEFQKSKYEFDFYQMQINPHFLFNTLESIRVMADKSRNDNLENSIIGLSEMLRYSLKSQKYVMVRDEIGCGCNYIDIINLKMNDKIELVIDTKEDVFDTKIVKMILQPLLENSVKHGFANCDKTDLFIKVKIKETKNNIFICVYDNGMGIEKSELDFLNLSLKSQIEKVYEFDKNDSTHNKLGLHNIVRRINLCYNGKGKMIIRSKIYSYTKIILQLPKLDD